MTWRPWWSRCLFGLLLGRREPTESGVEHDDSESIHTVRSGFCHCFWIIWRDDNLAPRGMARGARAPLAYQGCASVHNVVVDPWNCNSRDGSNTCLRFLFEESLSHRTNLRDSYWNRVNDRAHQIYLLNPINPIGLRETELVSQYFRWLTGFFLR